MRVIAGLFRGRTLQAPSGNTTRPTADRVRTALFDLLGPIEEGANVLDLFAGTGALGIEALSRGAGQATFVERDAAALSALRTNLARLGLAERARVVAGDATVVRIDGNGPFDLVFLDPPYGSDLGPLAVARVVNVVNAGGVLAVEESARTDGRAAHEPEAPPPPPGFALWKSRRYGGTRITLFVREAS